MGQWATIGDKAGTCSWLSRVRHNWEKGGRRSTETDDGINFSIVAVGTDACCASESMRAVFADFRRVVQMKRVWLRTLSGPPLRLPLVDRFDTERYLSRTAPLIGAPLGTNNPSFAPNGALISGIGGDGWKTVIRLFVFCDAFLVRPA